jgi:DNA-binding transcriptional regulator YiaG
MSKITENIAEFYDDLKELDLVSEDRYQEIKKLTAKNTKRPDAIAIYKPIEIKSIREEQLHWSQQVLADNLFVTVSTVSKWERGRAIPSPLHCKMLEAMSEGSTVLPNGSQILYKST